MPLDTTAFDHIGNVVRRQVKDEIRNLALVFIVHNTGGRDKALQSKIDEILDHPAGRTLLPRLKKMAGEKNENTEFAGMAWGLLRKMFALAPRRHALAVFFVNTKHITDQNDGRQLAYHLAWHAISLMQRQKSKDADSVKETDGVIRFAQSPVIEARQNMLADIFAAVMLELQGNKKSIRSLAYRRCLMALQAIPHYRAEQFPFAVTADAAEMVFEEMTANGSEVTKPVNFATQIAQEIDYTYDDTSMRQWWSFTTAAQEMAWLDFDKNKILGTAIYTSEDPYVRSTAYLVAEALNMEPAPLQDLGNYNPFTDQEVNERLHIRACDESFQTLMSQLVIDFNEHSLEDLIRRQNDRLMEGYPVGWCAHGLRLAFDAYQTAGASGERPADRALQAFVRGRDEVSWESLRSICRLVMHKRREEQKITPQMMAGFVRDKEGLHLICNAFGSVNEDIPAPAAQAPAKKKYIPGNMAAYMNPSNLVKTIIEGAEFKGMPGDKKPEE